MFPIDIIIIGLLLGWLGRHYQKQHGQWWGWVLMALGVFIVIAMTTIIYLFTKVD